MSLIRWDKLLLDSNNQLMPWSQTESNNNAKMILLLCLRLAHILGCRDMFSQKKMCQPVEKRKGNNPLCLVLQTSRENVRQVTYNIGHCLGADMLFSIRGTCTCSGIWPSYPLPLFLLFCLSNHQQSSVILKALIFLFFLTYANNNSEDGMNDLEAGVSTEGKRGIKTTLFLLLTHFNEFL